MWNNSLDLVPTGLVTHNRIPQHVQQVPPVDGFVRPTIGVNVTDVHDGLVRLVRKREVPTAFPQYISPMISHALMQRLFGWFGLVHSNNSPPVVLGAAVPQTQERGDGAFRDQSGFGDEFGANRGFVQRAHQADFFG